MRITRLAAALTATALLGLTAGCGEDKPAPQVAAEEFIQAILDEDGEAACSLLSDGEKPLTEEQVKDCAEDMVSDGMDAEERKEAEAFLEDGPTKVTEDGDRATVSYANEDGEDDDLMLVKIDGEWYLDFG